MVQKGLSSPRASILNTERFFLVNLMHLDDDSISGLS